MRRWGFIAALWAAMLPAPLYAQCVDTYCTAVLADAPLEYYRLEEPSGTVAADSSSGGLHPGTYNSSPTLGATGAIASAASNYAVSFAAATDNMVANSNSTSVGNWTIELWIKPNTFAQSGAVLDVFSNYSGYQPTVWLAGDDPAGPSLVLYDTGVCNETTTRVPISGATSWHHVVYAYNGATAPYLTASLDGSPVSIPGCQMSPSWGAAPWGVKLGSVFNGTWNVNVQLDDVAIYGSALSTGRVAAHYAAAAA